MRTPIGRYGGALAGVRPDDLAALVIAALVGARASTRRAIDDVILGCANQAGEDNRNVARMARCWPGCPSTRPRRDRQPAVRLGHAGGRRRGARAIATGEARPVIAGGVESMSRAPLVMAKPGEAFPRGDVDDVRHARWAGAS